MTEHDDGERIAVVESKVRSVEAEIHGTGNGLRTRIGGVESRLATVEGRMSSLAERIDSASDSWAKWQQAADDRARKVDEEITGRVAIDRASSAQRKTWLAPVVTGLVLAATLAVARIVEDRIAPPAVNVEQVARVAADEAIRTIRVKLQPSPVPAVAP